MAGSKISAITCTDPIGVIIFALGSGSSRLSPRNIFVAKRLVEYGFAALLFDLLTDVEAEDCRNLFDIQLLGARVQEVIAWASHAATFAVWRSACSAQLLEPRRRWSLGPTRLSAFPPSCLAAVFPISSELRWSVSRRRREWEKGGGPSGRVSSNFPSRRQACDGNY